jgi:hypothetical protein
VLQGFMLGTLADLVGQEVELPRAVEKWCMLFGFLIGGTLFTGGGACSVSCWLACFASK